MPDNWQAEPHENEQVKGYPETTNYINLDSRQKRSLIFIKNWAIKMEPFDCTYTTGHLRFGIMCTGTTFHSWQARCIQNLLSQRGVEAALLIVDDDPQTHYPLKQKVARLLTGKTVLWRLYERTVLNRASRSTRPIDLSPLLEHLPVVRCRTERVGRYSQRFQPDDLEEIRRYDLDFVLRFAFNIIRGEILNVPRYGVWSFHHGDHDKYRGAPPGFWEIYKRDPVAGAMLQRLTDRLDAGVILHRGYFRTIASSYPKSRDSAFFGSADWPARVCKDIQNGKAGYIDAAPSSTKAPVYRDPNSLHMLRFSWISAEAWVRNQIDSLFRHQQWSVGIINAPIQKVTNLAGGESLAGTPRRVHWLPEVQGRFHADPFALAQCDGPEGGLTILAEDYDWSQERGRIAFIESSDGRTFGAPHPAIQLPYHMSYPFLFEYAGAVYCVPETYEAREVSLFRAGSSLREWLKVATLVQDFPAVDSTIFRYNGRWWLFCTSDDAGANDKLFAWLADELTGPWVPHSANPLKTDVCSSRPAGRPFVYDGQLYRPAQDCSTGYGAAVVVNRVLSLTSDEFSEEAAAVLKPDPSGPYPNGLHTVCGLGDYTVIDGARRAFVRQAFTASMRKKGHRLLRKLKGRV